METQKPLLKDEDGEEVDVHMYRSMIGSLMYLTSSRPDIMFAVCAYARYQVNPKVSHLHVMKIICSDYAGASLDRKSTTRGCQFLGCRLISWQCKKQTVVANSTTEAEYVAASSCCGQVLWIQNQLLDYGYALTINTTIHISYIKMFWSTAMVKTINGEVQFHALVDGKKIIITESSVKRDLQLADEEGVDCLPNSIIFEQLTLMGNPKRKDTQVPQPSDPIKNVADEAVHKELSDSLVRAATTASSLEAEQDNGNINKTKSKATPTEFSSQGTNSGGGSWCQETIGDTIDQISFESESKHSNDSLLARGNTLQSDEDRLNLNKLMTLCTTLQNRVLDLEKTNTTQHNEISSLKRRVKKLEKKDRLRIHRLKRLYKVGLTARVESSDNEESLGEDASKQGRIDAINADEEITLLCHVVNVFAGEEVFATTVDDITLAQVLEEMKSTKPKKKRVVIQELDLIRLDEEIALNLQAEFNEEERLSREKAEKEEEDNIALIETWDDIQAKIDADHQLDKRMQAQEQEELSIEEKATLFQQLLEKRRKHFAAKRNMEGYKLKDLKLKEFDYIQEMFDRAFKRVNTFEDFRTEFVEGKEKRAGTELIQEITKKQKVEDDKETAELKQLMKIIPDEVEVAIDAIPLVVKSPSVVGWKIHKEGRKSYYQIMRADGKSQMYMIFSQMLKSFDRKDLEALYKLVKAKYESTRPVEDLDLKTMFEPHVEDKIYMLVEKKYPLAPLTLSMMLEKKLIIDYESEMAY
ncbi:hypothetical protein Tco_0322463 [Tanacetum coccineum]